VKLYHVITNDLGEPINVIYTERDLGFTAHELNLLEWQGWNVELPIQPEPAWEFFKNIEYLKKIEDEGL